MFTVNEQSIDLEIFLAIQAQQVKALDVLYDRASQSSIAFVECCANESTSSQLETLNSIGQQPAPRTLRSY